MAPRYGSEEWPYLWPLKRGTVGGQEGWLDPRSTDVLKLLPTKFGRIEGELDIRNLHRQNLAKDKSNQAWFRNTVKGTKPDLTPVKNVGGKEGMRSLLQERNRHSAWLDDWSTLNPDQIQDLGGKGARITNREAEQLMKADELAIQKSSAARDRWNKFNAGLTNEKEQNRQAIKTNITTEDQYTGKANWPEVRDESSKDLSTESNPITAQADKWYAEQLKSNNPAVKSGAWDDDKLGLYKIHKAYQDSKTTNVNQQSVEKPDKPDKPKTTDKTNGSSTLSKYEAASDIVGALSKIWDKDDEVGFVPRWTGV